MNSRLILFTGITFVLVGTCLKTFYKYYEMKLLSKKNLYEQDKYHRRQKELSDKGAYNIPFKDRKLLSTNNNVHDLNNFIIILGVITLVLWLIS